MDTLLMELIRIRNPGSLPPSPKPWGTHSSQGDTRVRISIKLFPFVITAVRSISLYQPVASINYRTLLLTVIYNRFTAGSNSVQRLADSTVYVSNSGTAKMSVTDMENAISFIK